MPVFAKTLAKQALQRVSLDRGRYLFTSYRKSDARAIDRILADQKRDAGVTNSNIVLKNLLKIDCAR
ncbi:MAG: hypothetical protein OES20_11225 [Gammaproteobacteria bacterium]|nr:hypothetical protein [Gammaproteobacteria bacterium]MDH3857761.1 hypothetical protein [Gammaproteobacteria bacterium]